MHNLRFYTHILKIGIFCLLSTVSGRATAAPMSGDNGILEKQISLLISPCTLDKAFEQVRKAGNISLYYDPSVASKFSVEAVEFKNAKIADILTRLLLKTSLTFQENGTAIVIRPVRDNTPKSTPAPPKTGGIKGKVYDEATGESLVGATIVLSGTTTGVSTDNEGNFTLNNLTPGNYGVQVSFISYQKKLINEIKVSSGNYTIINVPLALDTLGLGEVVVYADQRTVPIRNTNEISLINSIRTSDIMVTGISAEQITKSLDRNAGDVVRRAPGVSMLNSFVMVRGMAPRYNQTFINGMQMASTESYSRAFSFDLIPSGVIDAIEIYKMPAPELPGGFGGGIIKVKTKQSQNARRIQLNLSGEYDTDNSFTDLYTGSNDAKDDWLGMGTDDRDFPSTFRDKYYDIPYKGMYPEENSQVLKTMPAHNNLEKSNHSLNRSLGLNYYDSWRIGRVRVNNLTSLNYSYKREQWNRYDLQSNLDQNDGSVLDGIQKSDTTSVEKVRLNALQSLNVVINDNHKISFNLIANRNANDYTVFGAYVRPSGYRLDGSATHLGDTLPTYKQLSYLYKVDDMLNAQLSGEHTFGKHSVDWYYGQNWFESYVPDLQQYRFESFGTYNSPGMYQYDIYNNIYPRVYYSVTDKGPNGGLNYIFSLNDNSTLKAGLSYVESKREYETMKYKLSGAKITAAEPWLNLTEVLDGVYDAGSGYTVTKEYDAYSYDNTIQAAYLGWKQQFFASKLQVYGGVRYEYEFVQLYYSNGVPVTEEKSFGGETNEPIIYDLEGPYIHYWLPSINLSWNITDKQKLRAGYGKTVDRPFARERSMIEEYVPQDGFIYQGNKTLKNAELDNVDLRWEYYPTESEFISAGLFYKHIKNPIENQEWSGETLMYRLSVNFKEATLYGAEVELRKNLAFIPVSWADRFSVIANFTYTYTKLNNSFFSKDNLEWTGSNSEVKRPLSGSSPYLANANLYYTDPQLKTQLAVNYNVYGQRMVATNQYFGYLYENPHGQLDFTLIQPFGKYITLKAGVQNMLKKDITGWRDTDQDGEKDFGVLKEDDFDNALRISTLRTVYLGLTISF